MYKNSIFLPLWTRPRLQIGLNLLAIILPQLALNALGVYLLGATLFIPILAGTYSFLITRKILMLKKLFGLIPLLQTPELQSYKKLATAKRNLISSFVTEMSQQLKMTAPKIYYDKHDKSLGASMLTIGFGKYRISLTKGLVQAFERNELDAKTLKGILGHELSHGYNHDTILSQCIGVISTINYVYACLALCAIPTLTCTLGISMFFTSLSISFSAFFAINATLSAVASLGLLTYFCGKSIERATEFRADLTAAALTKDAPTVAMINNKFDQIFAKWGYQLNRDMFGQRAVTLPPLKTLVRLESSNVLFRYLRVNHAKLKRQKSQPARLRRFNRLKNDFHLFVRGLYQTGFAPTSNGNVRKKMDKYLHALLTPAQRQTLVPYTPLEVRVAPIVPWYEESYINACMDSFDSTHPCSLAREAVVLAANRNKVRMSSK